MEFHEIISNYGPVLLSSSVLGAMATTVAPVILKRMKKNFKYKQTLALYKSFKKDPERFEKKYPELATFFAQKGWLLCPCNNCSWLRIKIRK